MWCKCTVENQECVRYTSCAGCGQEHLHPRRISMAALLLQQRRMSNQDPAFKYRLTPSRAVTEVARGDGGAARSNIA